MTRPFYSKLSTVVTLLESNLINTMERLLLTPSQPEIRLHSLSEGNRAQEISLMCPERLGTKPSSAHCSQPHVCGSISEVRGPQRPAPHGARSQQHSTVTPRSTPVRRPGRGPRSTPVHRPGRGPGLCLQPRAPKCVSRANIPLQQKMLSWIIP